MVLKTRPPILPVINIAGDAIPVFGKMMIRDYTTTVQSEYGRSAQHKGKVHANDSLTIVGERLKITMTHNKHVLFQAQEALVLVDNLRNKAANIYTKQN